MSDSPKPPENIVLTGFMGSGKSSVGRLLAKRLRFAFVDMDILIEERARMSIKDMFAKHGENWFRDRETAALESLAGTARRHVISTGGGIVTQPRNLPLLRQIGWVVLLSAAPEEIYARVARNKDRPLLHVPDPRGRVRELLAERAPMYAAAAQFTVDSTGLRHEDVVATVLAEARRVFGWSK